MMDKDNASGRSGLPAEAREFLIEAYRLVEQGRPGGAADRCRRALELVPNWAEANTLYGAVLEQMGFEARAEAVRSRAEAPGAVSFDVERTRGLGEGWRTRSAGADGRQRPEQLLDAAQEAWEAGKPGSALRACASALEADPEWAEAHYLCGRILEDLDPEQADAAYQEAARLDPAFAGARSHVTSVGSARTGVDLSGPVVIRRFSFPSEAEIAKGRLEANGIGAVLVQAEIVAMNWLYSNMVGGVKLCVGGRDAEKALSALDWEGDAAESDVRCPACGSGNGRYERYNLRWVYTAILVLGFPLPVKRERWICRRCGASWKEEERC